MRSKVRVLHCPPFTINELRCSPSFPDVQIMCRMEVIVRSPSRVLQVARTCPRPSSAALGDHLHVGVDRDIGLRVPHLPLRILQGPMFLRQRREASFTLLRRLRLRALPGVRISLPRCGRCRRSRVMSSCAPAWHRDVSPRGFVAVADRHVGVDFPRGQLRVSEHLCWPTGFYVLRLLITSSRSAAKSASSVGSYPVSSACFLARAMDSESRRAGIRH